MISWQPSDFKMVYGTSLRLVLKVPSVWMFFAVLVLSATESVSGEN